MIPLKKIEELIQKHSLLEKDLTSDIINKVVSEVEKKAAQIEKK